MKIKGLEYNTQRKSLLIAEYGRLIQNMVDYAKTLPTKEQRQQCAETIIKIMENKTANEQRETAEMGCKLWDHLYIMSNKELDIDWPFDVYRVEKMEKRPQKVKLQESEIPVKHYGNLVGQLFKKLCNMPDGQERDELARLTANQMKRDLFFWGQGSMDDERVIDDLEHFTCGKIRLDLSQVRLERIEQNVQKVGNSKKKNK